MARNATITVLRTTRANLDAQAGASGLLVGEPYLITDEGRIAVGTAVNAYRAYALEDAIDDVAIGAYTLDGDTAIASSGNVTTIPLDGGWHEVTLTEDTLLALSGTPTAPRTGYTRVTLIQAASNWIVTYPSAWEWAYGEAVAIGTSAGDKITLWIAVSPSGSVQVQGAPFATI